jgi:hypothetical protein
MIKCPYCGKELDLQVMLTSATSAQAGAKTKWYFATYWFVIALMCIGPFALPLMWFNPRYKLITKIILSVVIIALSIWLYIQFKAALNLAKQQLGGLGIH